MLRMPVRLEIGIDFGIDDKNTRRSIVNPGAYRIEISKRPHGRSLRAVTASDRREIRFRKLDYIDRIALPAEVVHFGSVRAVVVNEDAQPQPQPDRRFEIRDRHQKTAVARTEHGQLARIGNGEADHRGEPKSDRLE